MADNIKYYVVKQKALPEVLLKVAETNRIIETENISVADANGIASLTLSVDILPTTGDSSEMIEQIERLKGVRYLKILSSDASI